MRTRRPWWVWLLLAFLGLAILGAIIGDDDKKSANKRSGPDRTTVTTDTSPAAQTATETTDEPVPTIADARQAVADDDYSSAITIATAMGDAQAGSIRKRIANRLAQRAFAALRAGDRGRARTLLIESNDYPSTTQKQQARASYKAAKARAVQRRQARSEAQAAAKAQREAERRAQREAEQTPSDPTDSGTNDPGQYAGMTCSEIGHSFIVPPGSDPDHDANNDGVACESE